jgi:hypothetical protein
MTLRSRPATAADVQHFYPGLTVSVRAWVCEVDGHPAGIMGIALMRPAHSIFSIVTEELRPHLGSIVIGRMTKRLSTAIAQCRAPVLAVRERSEPKSARLLKRLGFRFHLLLDGDAIYRFEGES